MCIDLTYNFICLLQLTIKNRKPWRFKSDSILKKRKKKDRGLFLHHCFLFGSQSAFCLLLSGDLSPFIGERERLRLLLCLLPDRDLDRSPRERSRLDLSLKQQKQTTSEIESRCHTEERSFAFLAQSTSTLEKQSKARKDSLWGRLGFGFGLRPGLWPLSLGPRTRSGFGLWLRFGLWAVSWSAKL